LGPVITIMTVKTTANATNTQIMQFRNLYILCSALVSTLPYYDDCSEDSPSVIFLILSNEGFKMLLSDMSPSSVYFRLSSSSYRIFLDKGFILFLKFLYSIA
jgi:hypothetical protein